MIKKIITTWAILVAGISPHAQVDYYKYTMEESNVGVDIDRYHFGTDIYSPDNINGSPYHNDTYQSGVLYENNKVMSTSLFFRYNAVGDFIEIKKNIADDDTERKILIKEPTVYVKVANDLLIYNTDSQGYFQVLVLGNNFKLYKKLNKKYFPPRLARNSFEKEILATYKDDPIYYIVSKDEKFFELPATKNKREKFFASKKIELKKFIDRSDLDLNEEKNLIRVFRYFDSFEDINLK
jgi:hypothetical protein